MPSKERAPLLAAPYTANKLVAYYQDFSAKLSELVPACKMKRLQAKLNKHGSLSSLLAVICNSLGRNNFDARNVFGDECKGNDECRAGDDKGEMLGCQEFQYREEKRRSESPGRMERRRSDIGDIQSVHSGFHHRDH